MNWIYPKTGRTPIWDERFKRAVDFVKCEDPACEINKKWAERWRLYNWPESRPPHCHPTF